MEVREGEEGGCGMEGALEKERGGVVGGGNCIESRREGLQGAYLKGYAGPVEGCRVVGSSTLPQC